MTRFKFALAALLAAGIIMFGQTTATLNGTVSDKSGAAVPNAEVNAINVDTRVERKVTSNDDGSFTIPFLAPGNYRVVIQKQGFRSVNQENVRLEVNQVARLDVGLEVGQVSESVNVTEKPPAIESESSSIGQVVETKAIQDLPLNGRNFVQLAILGPGVTGVGFSSRGTIMSGSRPDDLRPGSEIFANGNREGSNNFLIDGSDNNDRLTLSIVLRPSVEAVREFKIQTNMFAAEQGRNSGATVNVLTKSGSNEWHGSAYEFLRNDKMDARNYFANPAVAKPAFRQNQFGASFGGKVIPNKLFFFTNYEGFRRRIERTFVNTVPTMETRVGNFTGVRDIFDPLTTRADASLPTGFRRDPFPGRIIPTNRLDSVMGKFALLYPAPQRSGLVNNHTSQPKEAQQWDQGDGRLDWNWNEKNTVYGRFSRQDTLTTRPSTFTNVTGVPGASGPVGLGNEDTFAGDSKLNTYNANLSWIRTFTPTVVMEARMGFSRFNLTFLQEGATPGAQLGEKAGIRGANQGQNSDGLPIFSPAGYTGIGQTRSLPIYRIQNTFHPTVQLTKLTGKHTIKGGFETRRRQVTQFQTNRGNGRFNFARTFTDDPNNTATTGDAMAALLLGTASTIEQDFTLVFPGMRFWEYGTFIQDDWKVNSRLTINMGIRYELDTPVMEVANRISNFDVTTGKLLIAGFNSDRHTNIKADGNNWAPRLGFAFRLTNKTVLRGGGGIFYNPVGSEAAYLRLHRQLPFGPINAIDINQFNPNPRRVQDGLPAIPVLDPNIVSNNPTGGMIAIDQQLRSGYAQQFNFQIQQALPKDLVFKIGYVGNLGRDLDYTYDINQPVPGPGAPGPRRPLIGRAPNVVGVTYNTFDGRSAYHSLQSTLERRFANGIGFLTAYTWAHSIDNVPNAFGGADNGPIPQDSRYRNVDRGSSGFDIRHRVTHSMNWSTPFGKGRRWGANSNAVSRAILGGWDMNVIFTAQTGLPFTPVLNTSVSNSGASRPMRLGSGEIANPDRAMWFDTSFNTAGAAWGVPQTFTFGNSGRNILRGPGRINWDYSLFKDFSPSEKWRLQFRAEFFNLLNTPQFDLPNPAVGSPNAGIITSTVGNPRQTQLGLRLSF